METLEKAKINSITRWGPRGYLAASKNRFTPGRSRRLNISQEQRDQYDNGSPRGVSHQRN